MTTNILIPDGDSIWTLPVIKCLAFRRDFKVFILSSKKWTAAKCSRSKFYYKYYPKTDQESWLEIINKEIESNAIDVVIPISEIESQFFIKNSNSIVAKAKVIPLASNLDFETATYKNRLGAFCEENQIAYPKSRHFDNADDFFTRGNELKYPVLLKPVHDLGGNGIVLFDSQKELEIFVSNKKETNDSFFIQEFIDGHDIDCSVLCLNGEILTYTIQKGFLLGNNPFAPSHGIEFMDNKEVLEITKLLMKALNWSGIAHLDLRYDKIRECYLIIEVNARFWGTIEASRMANINFPVLLCDLTMGKNISHTEFKSFKYLSFKGLLKHIIKHPVYAFDIRSILQSTEAKSVLNDPLPTLYNLREWVGRKF